MAKLNKAAGYLPDEKPSFWKLVLYALQQVVVMFPATVTVALITGFQVSTTIFASGLATLCFILITGKKIPLYYGSSFAYLSAVIGLMTSDTVSKALTSDELAQLNGFLSGQAGVFTMPQSAIEYAQVGIVMSGLVSIAAGLIVKFAGIKAVERVLPPTITGPVAMIIGLTLAGNALADAAPKALADGATATVFNSDWVWAISLVTLLSTILYSRYLKGFLGQLPLLLGAATGCIAAALLYRIGGADYNIFRGINSGAIESIYSIGPFAIPKLSLPNFGNPKIAWASIAAIMPIAIATIPESTAHMYQLDIYVNAAAAKKNAKKYNLIEKLHLNLIGDGIGDMVTGFIGGPAGTNYGENISTMAITKVFSVPVLIVAAIFAMVISCFTPLIQVIYGIPLAVIGGLEIYLFGAIAAQGIAILIDKKADMFSSANIAVIASIMVIGIGGQYVYGGNIPFFGINVPCIAGAAIFGIVLNLILSIGSKKEQEAE
jgi:uracil permease